MKKITATSFLFLAWTVLLALALIPHHHHREQVCMTRSHCSHDTNPLSSGTTGHDHHHDGDNHSGSCFLMEGMPVLAYHDQFVHGRSFHDGADHPVHGFPSTVHPVIDFPEPTPCFQDRALIPLFSSYVYSSLGLRAPPAV